MFEDKRRSLVLFGLLGLLHGDRRRCDGDVDGSQDQGFNLTPAL